MPEMSTKFVPKHMHDENPNPKLLKFVRRVTDRIPGKIKGIKTENDEDAVEDLIILAKQDVPFTDMKEVLSSMLVSLPTSDMLKALQDLSDRIPRWIWFSSSRVQ